MSTAVLTATLVISGLGQRFDPEVMAQVVETRVALGQLPPGTDPHLCVAVVNCGLLGQSGTLIWPGGWRDRVTICDCSAAHDADRHRRKGLAVEVAFSLAERRCHPVGQWCLPRDGPLPDMRLELWPPFRQYMPL
jgi:hypothetical protein